MRTFILIFLLIAATGSALAAKPLGIAWQQERFVIASAPSHSSDVDLVEAGPAVTEADSTDARVLATVFFAVNATTVVDAYRTRLNILARTFPNAPLRIVGHADPSGNPDRNLALSRARAMAVRDVLLEAGATESALGVVALGDTEPACETFHPDCLARSRRVEVIAP